MTNFQLLNIFYRMMISIEKTELDTLEIAIVHEVKG